MDLGEKLTVIADAIYENAVTEITARGVSPTLAALIMENVSGRFQAAAYRTINAVRAAEEAERERRRAEEVVEELRKEAAEKAAEKEEASTEQTNED